MDEELPEREKRGGGLPGKLRLVSVVCQWNLQAVEGLGVLIKWGTE